LFSPEVDQISTFFFREYAGELRIIILRRKTIFWHGRWCIFRTLMQVDGKSGPVVFSSMSTWLGLPLGTLLQHLSVQRKQFLQ
jgi:hypothetical protein